MRLRYATITTVVLAVMALGAPPALAAPPGNDDFANATTVTEPLPFTDSVDTSEATVEATDPVPDCVDTQNTVWYAYTPTASGLVEGNSFGSDYDTTLSVWTGSPGSFSQVACNDDFADSVQSKVTFDATASTTYYFMAGSFDASDGGSLVFNVQVGTPSLQIDDLTISPTGSVNARAGTVVINGTITCSGPVGTVGLDVFVTQRIGRFVVQGEGFDVIECSGQMSWSIDVEPFNGLFVGGHAHAFADAFSEESELSTDSNVRLRGH